MYWKSNRITHSQSFKNLLNLNFLVCYRPFKFQYEESQLNLWADFGIYGPLLANILKKSFFGQNSWKFQY